MREFLKVLLIAAVLGVLAFMWFASQLTTVEHPDPSAADHRFRAALQAFEDPTPMLTMDAGGRIIHNQRKSTPLIPAVPIDVVVLAWRGPTVGLVETRLPIWFLRLKGPAIRYLLRGTAFDPEPWGLTVDDIQAWGPGIVIDHRGGGSYRTLIWSE